MQIPSGNTLQVLQVTALILTGNCLDKILTADDHIQEHLLVYNLCA